MNAQTQLNQLKQALKLEGLKLISLGNGHYRVIEKSTGETAPQYSFCPSIRVQDLYKDFGINKV